MLKSLMASALGAGLGAGLVAAALQLLLVSPLIAEAELYETGALTHFVAGEPAGPANDAAHGHADGQDAAAHGHDDGDEAGASRALLTVVSTAASYTAFALFLVAAFAIAERAGAARVSARTGVLWGMAGFAATQLAPAVGLAPELPGVGAAALENRQLWWLVTALLTAAGLAALALVKGPLRLAGLVLVALPHLIGAPHPEGYAGVTPPELAAHFAARALAVGAVAWIVLGWLAGRIWAHETAGT